MTIETQTQKKVDKLNATKGFLEIANGQEQGQAGRKILKDPNSRQAQPRHGAGKK